MRDVAPGIAVHPVSWASPSAERLPRLFRKFSRAQSEEQGGDTALGLAIRRGIVEAHGGHIWAESDGPGLGAVRFSLS